jgi:hypothetical protein
MRLATSTIAVAFVVVTAAAAQTTSAQTGTITPRGNVSETITVTGCLERAEQAATPTTGTTGAMRVAPQAFVLINASLSTGAKGSVAGTTYVLDGGRNLTSSVGRRVEIKGTATSPAASISAGAVPPPPEPHEAGAVTGGTPGTADTPAASSHPRIRVASVRVLGDCSSTR